MTSHTGIDCRDGRCVIAEVASGGERPEVHRLLPTDPPVHPGSVGDSLDALRLVIPDRLAMVKPLWLSAADGNALTERVKFELSQSLLDSLDLFDTECYPTSLTGHYLAVVVRRADVHEVWGRMLDATPGDSGVHIVRARALANGYRHFCKPESGRLLALADLSGGEVSVALLYDGGLVALAAATPPPAGSIEAERRLAVDLKTVINFKISSLAGLGITIPLSKLLLCGGDDALLSSELFARFFPCGVARPIFHEEYFPDSIDRQELHRYLPALGAAAY